MARVKRGVTSHAKHKKVLKAAKGFYGRRKNTIRIAKQAVEKSLSVGTVRRRSITNSINVAMPARPRGWRCEMNSSSSSNRSRWIRHPESSTTSNRSRVSDGARSSSVRANNVVGTPRRYV